MRTKLLVYDDNCPLCSWYSSLFTKYGWLPKDGRVAFSTLPPELLAAIDTDKGRNEIPLIDTRSGKVLYGIDALLDIFGSKYPLIQKIGTIGPINYFLKKLYKLISYNRKVIVAKKCGTGRIDCAPDMNYFYRALFLALFFVFNTFMLYPIHQHILSKLTVVNVSADSILIAHFAIAGVNGLLSLNFSREKLMDYLGQANMLALTAILLQLPLILLIRWFHLTEWAALAYLGIVMIIIFREYIRRMDYAGILQCHQWVAGINFACMTGFVLFIFS